MPFSIETFIGLHIYLVAADLIYNILDKFVQSLYENLISPGVNALFGENFFSKLQWNIGSKDEKGEFKVVIDIGAIIAEGVKVFLLALFAFNVYKYFKKYEKYRSLKK